MNFNTDKKSLTIELTGREQIWALKSKIIVFKKDILNIDYLNSFRDWRKWEIRLPGTGLPGRLVAGSFWTEEGWDFLYLKNTQGWLNPLVKHVLYIETKNQKYKRIIISINKEQAFGLINWATK